MSDLIRLQSDVLKADIAPRHGAAIASLAERGTGFALLRPTAEADIAAGNVRQFGCFPLLPYSNRMGFRRMQFGGRTLTLAANRPDAPHSFHGNGWMSAWTAREKQADALTLELRHAGDEHWPFRYEAEQVFRLEGNRFSVSATLFNSGKEAFPAGGGWHPFFATGAGTTLRFDAERVWLNDEDMLPQQAVAARGDWHFGAARALEGVAIDNCFDGWSGTAQLMHPASRRRVTLNAGEPLSKLVVFRRPDVDGFIALEPVSHVNDGINLAARGHADTGMRILAPGESLGFSMSITLDRL
ncbi:aldose 1-epimerase [Noviherbaspirillum humi]|uniref:Aldose 1-epimerase n=1 Tax=Noviherbaspirillum humi TaxID=1688639 RepID=A0A239C3C5_9BURK|nr:aldose 1-epimerase [Noviherbaspirillum humi]SNS14767.1 aldose 1-epimerase [Noviherbaspirillum humi]